MMDRIDGMGYAARTDVATALKVYLIDMVFIKNRSNKQTVSHQNLGIGRQEDPTKEPDVLLAGLRWRT